MRPNGADFRLSMGVSGYQWAAQMGLSFRDNNANHFVKAEAAVADIDDSIKPVADPGGTVVTCKLLNSKKKMIP